MEEIIIKHKQHNITVYKSGSGPTPIVLLHGSGLDSAILSWREVMNLMPDQYTVYAIDLLGYGKSDRVKDMRGKDFYQKHISAIEDLVDRLELKEFILSGLSMGGAISIGYALKNPDRVMALIPINSWGLVSKMPMHMLYYWYIKTPIQKVSFQLLAKFRWMVEWSIRYSLIGDRRNIPQSLIDEIHALCQVENPGQSLEDYQKSSITRDRAIPDYIQEFKELQMPVLFISGEKDPLVKTKDMAKAAETVKNGQLHIMKGCKHWSQKERPEEYIRVVDEFYDHWGQVPMTIETSGTNKVSARESDNG